MPLPPYITKQLEDQSQYQTVYAKELGSAAAPTAGLHFTSELMDTIRAKGVNIAEVQASRGRCGAAKLLGIDGLVLALILQLLGGQPIQR